MGLRSFRRRLVHFLFGVPRATESKILCEKFENTPREKNPIVTEKPIECDCSGKPFPNPPKRPIDPEDRRYPVCNLDETDECYWYLAREDYLVMPLFRELFGPDRVFWLKIYPNFISRRDRRYPKAVLYFPCGTTQAEETTGLYILEWLQMPPPGTYGRPLLDEKESHEKDIKAAR